MPKSRVGKPRQVPTCWWNSPTNVAKHFLNKQSCNMILSLLNEWVNHNNVCTLWRHVENVIVWTDWSAPSEVLIGNATHSENNTQYPQKLFSVGYKELLFGRPQPDGLQNWILQEFASLCELICAIFNANVQQCFICVRTVCQKPLDLIAPDCNQCLHYLLPTQQESSIFVDFALQINYVRYMQRLIDLKISF